MLPKKNPFSEFVHNDTYVECEWYRNGEYKTQISHQNRLMKLRETGGLYRTQKEFKN